MNALVLKKKPKIVIRKYLALTRAGLLEALTFRNYYLVILLGNILYQIITFFLWKAIYASSSQPIINGMSFKDTMIYVMLASAMFNFMEVSLVWEMQSNIQTGRIIIDMLRPTKYFLNLFFNFLGSYIVSFCLTFIPAFLIVDFVSEGTIVLGTNILFYLLSICIGIVINFSIDFIVGLVCFFTQSVWGINTMKETVVLLLSGAAVPLVFFPEKLKMIAKLLPFHTIYNTPLKLLIEYSLSIERIIKLLSVQVIWMLCLLILANITWRKISNILSVNGG